MNGSYHQGDEARNAQQRTQAMGNAVSDFLA
jgi:hypothetical protein